MLVTDLILANIAALFANFFIFGIWLIIVNRFFEKRFIRPINELNEFIKDPKNEKIRNILKRRSEETFRKTDKKRKSIVRLSEMGRPSEVEDD